RVDDDGVQAHPAGAGLPVRARAVLAQARQLLPGPAAVVGAEQRRVLDTGVDHVGIGVGGLERPHPRELPGMGRAVVPLVRAGNAVVDELVAHWLPRLAAVVGALDELAEPARVLRREDALRRRRRSLHVVDLPPCEVGAADLPLLPLAVRFEDESALARP